MSNKSMSNTSAKKQVSQKKEKTEVQEESANTAEKELSADNVADEPVVTADEKADGKKEENIELKYAELNDSYLRLMAEFDNYRKRTLREKADLIRSGGESVLTNLLPVIDDFERAISNSRNTDDIAAIVQGIELIYNKFTAYLSQQGVKAIEAVGKPFDTELFEAIATIPAPSDDSKGMVLDCIQTGYVLNDKVIRHAKVVVGV
ncbi:MAG: nucleotide exchange factor GrpE [Tannerella sp.]|jgi:molecular chaperone GrpE|nr:nucleotide exchange factor GrpE [Tannerella sp.]